MNEEKNKDKLGSIYLKDQKSWNLLQKISGKY